jgi:hypothetical protein
LNCITIDGDSPPGSIMIVSSDPEDGAKDGGRSGSALMPFSEELGAAERVSGCHALQQNMSIPAARWLLTEKTPLAIC